MKGGHARGDACKRRYARGGGATDHLLGLGGSSPSWRPAKIAPALRRIGSWSARIRSRGSASIWRRDFIATLAAPRPRHRSAAPWRSTTDASGWASSQIGASQAAFRQLSLASFQKGLEEWACVEGLTIASSCRVSLARLRNQYEVQAARRSTGRVGDGAQGRCDRRDAGGTTPIKRRSPKRPQPFLSSLRPRRNPPSGRGGLGLPERLNRPALVIGHGRHLLRQFAVWRSALRCCTSLFPPVPCRMQPF